MPVSTELATLEAPRNELHQELATLGGLCLGSLLSRYQKCGKATFLFRRMILPTNSSSRRRVHAFSSSSLVPFTVKMPRISLSSGASDRSMAE